MRIAIVDDNPFFNKLITKAINRCTTELWADFNLDFDVRSYTDPNQFRDQLSADLNIAFLDYYLGKGVTGKHLLTDINYTCSDCKVAILSAHRNNDTVVKPVINGAWTFMFKDKNVFARSCMFIEDIVLRLRNDAV